MTNKNRAMRMLRLTLPPVLTIGTSAFILFEAYGIHEKQQNSFPPQNPTALNTVSVQNSTGYEPRNNTATSNSSGKTAPSTPKGAEKTTKAPSSQKTSSGSSGSAGSSDSDHGHTKKSSSKKTKKPTAYPTKDEGFTPVSGGKLRPAPSPANLSLAQPFSSVVTQYGAYPETTFSPSNIYLYYGIQVKLKLPAKSNVSKNQILAVPLQAGMLWAIVPKIGGNQGTGPTPLYYSQYNKSGNSVTLSPQTAQLLGKIPVTTTSLNKVQTSWYRPASKSGTAPANSVPGAKMLQHGNTTNKVKTGTNNNTTMATAVQTNASLQKSPSNSTASSSGSKTKSSGSAGTNNTTDKSSTSPSQNATNNTTNSSTVNGNTTNSNTVRGTKNISSNTTAKQTSYQITPFIGGTKTSYSGVKFRTISDKSGANLLLQGLYQVTGGAVIQLMTKSGNETGSWVYFWNERKQALMPICAVENTHDEKGWTAIGQQTMYWGQRSLLPPQMQYYKGNQYLLNFASMKTYPIRLGTWTSGVMAGRDLSSSQPDGNQNEDNLYFEVQNSGNWKEFIPNEHY